MNHRLQRNHFVCFLRCLRARATTDAVLLALLAACISVLFIRAIAVFRYGALFGTSGTEGSNIYALWRLLHGHPLYESPLREPYTLTPYNFLFYHSYAAILRLLRLTIESDLWVPRFVTLAFASFGAFVQYGIMRDLLQPHDVDGRARRVLVAVAVITWLGPGLTGWWALTVRPDLPAVAMSCAGLFCYLRARARTPWALLSLASCLFFLAWSLKQVTVWILVGVMIDIARRGSWRLAVVALPCGVLMVLSLVLGGTAFRYNIIVAQSLNGVSLRQALVLVALACLGSPPIWLIPVAGLFAALSRRRSSGERARPSSGLDSVLVVGVTSAMMGFVALGREGSSRNQLFEAAVCLSVIAGVTLVRASARPIGRAALVVTVANLACLASLAQILMQLAVPDKFGKLTFTATEYAARQRQADLVRALPTPVLLRDDILGQPWFATSNKYPSVLLVSAFYDEAMRRGLLAQGGVPEMIRFRRVASLALAADDPWIKLALSSGYTEMKLPPLGTGGLSGFVLAKENHTLAPSGQTPNR